MRAKRKQMHFRLTGQFVTTGRKLLPRVQNFPRQAPGCDPRRGFICAFSIWLQQWSPSNVQHEHFYSDNHKDNSIQPWLNSRLQAQSESRKVLSGFNPQWKRACHASGTGLKCEKNWNGSTFNKWEAEKKLFLLAQDGGVTFIWAFGGFLSWACNAVCSKWNQKYRTHRYTEQLFAVKSDCAVTITHHDKDFFLVALPFRIELWKTPTWHSLVSHPPLYFKHSKELFVAFEGAAKQTACAYVLVHVEVGKKVQPSPCLIVRSAPICRILDQSFRAF